MELSTYFCGFQAVAEKSESVVLKKIVALSVCGCRFYIICYRCRSFVTVDGCCCLLIVLYRLSGVGVGCQCRLSVSVLVVGVSCRCRVPVLAVGVGCRCQVPVLGIGVVVSVGHRCWLSVSGYRCRLSVSFVGVGYLYWLSVSFVSVGYRCRCRCRVSVFVVGVGCRCRVSVLVIGVGCRCRLRIKLFYCRCPALHMNTHFHTLILQLLH